jgi:hypothetical protein
MVTGSYRSPWRYAPKLARPAESIKTMRATRDFPADESDLDLVHLELQVAS